MSMSAEPKKNNTVVIIAVVAIVLCCCCLGVIGLLWNFGDAIIEMMPTSGTFIKSLGLL